MGDIYVLNIGGRPKVLESPNNSAWVKVQKSITNRTYFKVQSV